MQGLFYDRYTLFVKSILPVAILNYKLLHSRAVTFSKGKNLPGRF